MTTDGNSTPGIRRCSRCGTVLGERLFGGLCPKCMAESCLEDLSSPEPEPEAAAERDRSLASDETKATVIQYFGDYELLEEAGRGGCGIVHKARQVSLNRLVAVKLISPDYAASASALARFQREARAASTLEHPNILPLFEIGAHEGQSYYSMKWVEGASLSRQIRGGQWGYRADEPHAPLTREDQIRMAELMEKIALAISRAHASGVLHRDLKPDNILVEPDGHPYVADFGLAKLADSDHSVTRSSAVLGTPAYIAPELISGGARQSTPSCDIYGLGCILYELISGRPPFGGGTIAEIFTRVAECEPQQPSSIRPGVERDLETICLKCLEKDPGRRYCTAAEVAAELRRFIEDVPIQARAVNAAERLWRWSRRRPLVATLTVTSCILLVAVLATSFTISRLKVSAEASDDLVPKQVRAASRREAGRYGDEKHGYFVCWYPTAWKIKETDGSQALEVRFTTSDAEIHLRVVHQKVHSYKVTQTDPPWVEIEGFKLTHPERGQKLQIFRDARRIGGFYGQQTHGASTRSNPEFNRAGLGDPQDRPGTQGQPQYRPQLRSDSRTA